MADSAGLATHEAGCTWGGHTFLGIVMLSCVNVALLRSRTTGSLYALSDF